MAIRKKTEPRPWTAVELRMLKGLAQQQVALAKIARSLKRSGDAVQEMAEKQGVSIAA